MNQNIKIRVFDKKHKSMIDWDNLTANAWNHFLNDEPTSILFHLFKNKPEDLSVMSFTNKHDITGKEIFVGDIVEIKINHCSSLKSTFLRYLIVFHQDGFQGCNLIKKYKVNYLQQEVLHQPKRFNYKEWDRMRIIGNFHENKEMLKGIFAEESEVKNG